MRSLHIGMLIILISTVTACSSRPSTDKLAKELKSMISWAATAHLVGDSWLKDSVPTVYAKQTLQASQEELEKEASTLAKVSPMEYRTKALDQLESIEHILEKMSMAIDQKNRSTLAQNLKELSTQEQALHLLVKETGGQP